MSILNNSLLLGAPAGASTYQVSKSLRFNASDSAYLSRTPASAGNRKTWTWSGWVKRAALGSNQQLFGSYNYPSPAYYDTGIVFNTSDQLYFFNYDTSAWNGQLTTAAVFRDTAAYYHVVVSCDTNAATPVKIYVNGVQQTLSGTQPSASSNTAINYTSTHAIGAYTPTSGNTYFFSGYLAECYLIDGQQLTPSSFGETNATTGQWVPRQFSGSYGSQGWKLTFSDNSNNTATTLGKDTSGNGNNWTPTNFSVTAGAGNDSLVDTPTSYGTDTGVGGEVRGNYCTLNPLASAGTFSNGNLELAVGGSGESSGHGTFLLPASGKWYWEIYVSAIGSDYTVGISTRVSPITYLGATYYGYRYSGVKVTSGAGGGSYGAAYTTGDLIGVAFDADSGAITFYKNGSSQGQAFTGITGQGFVPLNYVYNNASAILNFGQRPFAYPVSGFKALCDTNLPSPLIAKGSTVMDVKLYTGNGGTQTISGLGFSPDVVWLKSRSGAFNHALFDTVRSAGYQINPNLTDAETLDTTKLSAFTSDGFTLGSAPGTNGSGSAQVAWCWDAGTSTVTNTQGSITSQVRANASAGFSIVSYTSVGTSTSLDTVGHGLGVSPSLAFIKNRDLSDSWWVYSSLFSDPTKDYLVLNSTAAKATFTSTTYSASSTTIGVRQGLVASSAGQKIIIYAFAPVAGYSSFGSYTGNGSTDGPFVYTGMRPRFLIYKRTDAADTFGWIMIDSSRDSYNVATKYIGANTSAAEAVTNVVDFLSNGFKLRLPGADGNVSGGTYVYAAFAENPFQYARAR